jgi:hypothetical protein
MLRGAYDKGRDSSDQMKRDLEHGRENAKREISDAPLSRDGSPSESQTRVR